MRIIHFKHDHCPFCTGGLHSDRKSSEPGACTVCVYCKGTDNFFASEKRKEAEVEIESAFLEGETDILLKYEYQIPRSPRPECKTVYPASPGFSGADTGKPGIPREEWIQTRDQKRKVVETEENNDFEGSPAKEIAGITYVDSSNEGSLLHNYIEDSGHKP